MAFVELADLMVSRGGSVDPSRFPSEIFDLYSIPAFDRGASDLVSGDEIGSSKQVVQPGDVLLSKIVPHIRRAWVVGAERGHRLIASGEWIVFRHSSALPRYLRHVLTGDEFHVSFMATVSGIGGSLLRARPAFVAKIRIPLPPIEEQRRIADILDRANALRAKRREAIALLDDLAQSIFLQMFGDEAPTEVLGEHVEEFRYGTSNKSTSSGYPALRIPNVVRGSINTTEIKTVPLSATEFQRLQLIDGDMLFVRTNGNPEAVGRCAVFSPQDVQSTSFSPNDFTYASYLIRARLKRSLNPVFLRDYLGGVRGRADLRSRCKTSAGQYNINIDGLRAVGVPAVGLDLQQVYARRVSVVNDAASVHRDGLVALDRLFSSLQQRAFSGLL